MILKPPSKINFFGVSLIFLITIFDRLAKIAIENSYFSNHRLGWRYFAIEQFHNPGIAFGVPIPLWIVLLLTVLFLIGLHLWSKKDSVLAKKIAFMAIFAGALSNAFDRVTYGYTIDYLRIINAIINIADILILIGILSLVISAQKEK